jgi:hypothetical protein
MLRRFAMWLVWNVPLGRMAPHVMGFAMGSKPIAVEGEGNE